MKIILIFYIILIYIIYNSSDLLIVYILLELNIIIFLMLRFYTIKKTSKFKIIEKIFFYFILQTILSITIIYIFRSIEYKNFGKTEISATMMLILYFKIGIFPFSFWIYKIANIEQSRFYILLVLQKLPFFSLIDIIPILPNIIILLLNLTIGTLYLNIRASKTYILISSSIYNIFWIFVILINNTIEFIMYYILYIFLTYVFLFINFNRLVIRENITVVIIFLFLVRTPPILTFILKYNFIINLLQFNLLLKLYIVFFVILSIYCYMKFFYKYLFNYNINYKINLKRDLRTLLIILIIYIMFF